jgi:peroxiredoxin
MTNRLAFLTMLVFGISVFCLASAETPAQIGKRVGEFQLPDTEGKTVSLSHFKDKKAIVVVFTGTECPINNLYMPVLANLHKEFSTKGVQFLAINSNLQDTMAKIKEHAKAIEVPFPVLKDKNNMVADHFGAQRTPEVYLLDATRTIRYQGRIDDQFGVGYKRGKPTRRDLAEAVNQILAGQAVTRATTPVAGCLIARIKDSKAEGTVTYTKQIAPLVQKHCQECHRPSQIGPMPLLTYDDVSAWSGTIREVIEERRMPPWHADPQYGRFANDRSLTDAERNLLLSWLDSGTPKGDDKDLPAPREFAPGWRISKPDVVFHMRQEYEVQADMPKYGVPYRYFTVETGFKEDKWVAQAEAVAGAKEVVHHVIVFVAPPDQQFFPGNPFTPALTGTAPGDMPLLLPTGTAKKIPAGSKLVFQMHYTPNGKVQKDRSAVGIVFARGEPEHRVYTEPIAFPPSVQIPAGDDNYKVEADWRFRENGHIISFMPHMHLRGKDFLYEAVYPDGKKEILLSVPRYNFNWQSIYRLEKPKPVPKGTKIQCLAHFDNSAKNLNNPDPTKKVFWGDQTWEEMMIGWMDYYYDRSTK